ncbi:MAG: response regulator [Lachnospiraceae bacterium]
MKKIFNIILSILVLISLGLGAIPVQVVAESGDVLRVACHPAKGFFEYDPDGDVHGYGVDVLEKISQYSNVQFEYVEASSRETAKEMVSDGRADLCLPVAGLNLETEKEELSISKLGILDYCHVLMTTEDRKDLNYEDKDSFPELKVGISRDLAEELPVTDYLQELNITEDNLVFFDGYNQCKRALKEQKLDAVITGIMDYDVGYRILSRFCYQSGYICARKGSPCMKKLDEAIGQINLAEPTFFYETYILYYPESGTIPLTKEEQEYLNDIEGITFSFVDDQGYLSRLEKDGYKGVLPELAKLICARLGVAYRTNIFSPEELKASLDGVGETTDRRSEFFRFLNSQGVDVWMDQPYQGGKKSAGDILTTSPYFTKNYYLITPKGKEVDRTTARAAVVKGDPCSEDLYAGISEEQIVVCRNFEECFETMRQEKADYTIVDSLTAEYYLANYRNTGLTTKLLDYTSKSCMALTDSDNAILASILSKTLAGISQDRIRAICTGETAQQPQQSKFLKLVYDNPTESITIQIMVFVIGMIILVLVFRVYQSEQENEILKRSADAKMDFLSRMSHDIRTPMNAVLGMTYLAQKEENVPAAVETYLNKIEASGKYLLGLLNDILDMSKIENGKIEIQEAPVRVDEIRDSLMPIFETMAKEKGVKIITDFESTQGSVVIMDKLHTMQIYSNLMSNAIKFSNPGGTVYWKNEYHPMKDDRVRLEAVIRDEGCGMSESFLKKLFLPFERENQPGNEQSEGTGLGLSIVKSLVERMGGEISVESKLGEGTTFTVVMYRQLVSRNRNISQADKSQDEDACFIGKKVLVVEDQHTNMEIIRQILQRKGMEIVAAENGRKALDVFADSKEGEFQLILMDIRMPEMDGIEATRQIRALEREDAKSIPIIAMTANAYDEDREATRQAGMNEHLAKPVDPRILFDTIKKFI